MRAGTTFDEYLGVVDGAPVAASPLANGLAVTCAAWSASSAPPESTGVARLGFSDEWSSCGARLTAFRATCLSEPRGPGNVVLAAAEVCCIIYVSDANNVGEMATSLMADNDPSPMGVVSNCRANRALGRTRNRRAALLAAVRGAVAPVP